MNYPPDFPSVLIPHYTDKDGRQYFRDDTLTEWATKTNSWGASLPTIKGWRVEVPTAGRFYLLTDAGIPIFEGQSRNECVDHLDLMKTHKHLHPTI